MDDQPNLQQFLSEVSSFSAEEATPARPASGPSTVPPIGQVVDIAGSGSQVRLDAATLNSLSNHSDPSVAMSGQVGSQVKMVVGNAWLIANVRTMRAGDSGDIIANIDFLGEGSRDASGKMTHFRRGVTRYPIPGCEVMPVTTDDLRSVFAADDNPHVEIGTVYPTTTSVARFTWIRCCRSISRCWDRPVPVSRPRSR